MASNTIVLRSCDGVREEHVASGIFSPGHTLKLDSANKVLKTSVEGADGEILIGTEQALQGKNIDTAYAVSDLAFVWIPRRGDLGYVFLKAGTSYAIGDTLIQAGDGTLKKASAATTTTLVKAIVAVVAEALNLSATGAVSTRAIVRFL